MDTSQSTDGISPRFEPLDGRPGVWIHDPVENAQYKFHTADPVDPRPAPDDVPWCFPIDAAATVRTGTITVPELVDVYVRLPDSTFVASMADEPASTVDEARYYTVELSCTPIKFYLAAESRIEVRQSNREVEITFPDTDEIHIGARSRHTQPARTLTTTRSPEDLMRVVAEFGGALKTISCERSWPTLRGHPPLIEFGDTVELPGGSQRPETGVTIEVPPTPQHIFTVAPLTYYLGADLQPGSDPRLTTETGLSYALDRDEGFESTVTELLRHVFTLDCLTRTEGYYPVRLHEREQAAAAGDIDLEYASLYDASLAEQLDAYVTVPFEVTKDLRPEWRLTVDIEADIGRAETLPFLAGELATVRCFESGTKPEQERSFELRDWENEEGKPKPAWIEAAGNSETEAEISAAMDEFVRSPASSEMTSTATDDFKRSVAGTSRATDAADVSRENVFRIRDADTAMQSYIGDGFPIGANKASVESYNRQLELQSNAPSRLEITVVCNDEEMTEEIEVGKFYGARNIFEFDATVRENLTRRELVEVFQSDVDLLHYIGHVDSRGVQCQDGYLDFADVGSVGVTAFILNGCRSFRQGARLVEAGAVGGIVTLENVNNGLATKVGHHIARLLNAGWPLEGALNLVQDDALVGQNYHIVGDGSMELVSPDGGIPTSLVLNPNGGDIHNVTVRTFSTRQYGLGSMYYSMLIEDDLRYIAGGEIDEYSVTTDSLKSFFGLSSAPVPIQFQAERTNTTLSLLWSSDLDLDEI